MTDPTFRDKIICGDALDKEALNELCLFAGAGGGLLGSILLGWRSVCYVEKDAYCIDVLKARIADGYLCDAPIWDDIKTFNGKPWRGLVDVVTAGFPCQPFSVAGKRKGAGDDRNLWPETIRVIREVRPRYALCENVPGLISGDHGYFGRILDDLSQSGYDARWRIVSAADVGALHLRKRLWILAHSREFRWRGWDNGDARRHDWTLQATGSCAGSQQASMADTECSAAGLEEHPGGGQEWKCSRPPQPTLLRQGNGESGAEGAGAGGEDVADTTGEGEREEIRGILAQWEKKHDEGWVRFRNRAGSEGTDVPNASESGLARWHSKRRDDAEELTPIERGDSWWTADPADAEDATESEMGRVAHGVVSRVDRLKAIGNGQVPGVVRLAWMLLTGGGK